MNQKTIAIVGGGQAAAMAAAALRQQGFDGELHLFSDEQHLPYERPPLSKAMLLDDNPQLQPILPADWWREHNVQLHLGVTVQTLGRQTHQLVLADGQSYPWDRLLIATGAAARPLPLLDKLGDRCFTLRHAADVLQLPQPRFGEGRRLAGKRDGYPSLALPDAEITKSEGLASVCLRGQASRPVVAAIAGLVGSGRSELLETIYGARRQQSGEVIVEGHNVGKVAGFLFHPDTTAEDEETRKARGKVLKVGIDPHFAFANMLCDVAWARFSTCRRWCSVSSWCASALARSSWV